MPMSIKKTSIQQRQKAPQKVMICLGACDKSEMSLVTLDEGTVDHTTYIEKVLPGALKYGNEVFGSDQRPKANRIVE